MKLWKATLALMLALSMLLPVFAAADDLSVVEEAAQTVEVPAEEIPAVEIPVEEIPVEEVPVEEIPVEEVPVEEIPAEEVPVEEAPQSQKPVVNGYEGVYDGAAHGVTATQSKGYRVVIDGRNSFVKPGAYTVSYKIDQWVPNFPFPGFRWQTIENGEQTVVITPKVLSVEWGKDTFEYDGQKHIPEMILVGAVKGDQIVPTVGDAQKDAGTYTAVVSLNGKTADNGNYVLDPAQREHEFTISKKQIVVNNIVVKDKVYDGTVSAKIAWAPAYVDTGVWGEGLWIGNYSAQFEDADAAEGKNVIVNANIYPANPFVKLGNYAVTFVASASITRKDAIVAADPKTKKCNEPDPALTYTWSGFVGDESPEHIYIGRVDDTKNAAGVYEDEIIVAHSRSGANPNYNITFIPADLTIIHTDKGTLVKGKKPTCTKDGWKDYYTCGCEKFFEDEACTVEILDLDAWKKDEDGGKLDKLGHDWSSWKEINSTGIIKVQRTCSRCDASETALEELVAFMRSIARAYEKTDAVMIKHIDQIFNADEMGMLNELSLKDQLMVSIKALGFADNVKLSGDAKELYESFTQRVEAFSDEEKAEMDAAMEEYFPVTTAAIGDKTYDSINFTLVFTGKKDNSVEEKDYTFVEYKGSWVRAVL